ncbi:MAG TPA: GMC family oxidoreductase [Alphaproteobacteria bacterium]|nr:GMC family oxidoreductase [Alphaproteobacteria bacterium]
MATKLKDVDAVMVGMGWTGAIMARELTKAGLTVVGIERGQDRNPKEEFGLTTLRDEVRYARRLELMQDNSIDTITFRNEQAEGALPIRRFGAFLPGEGVGGSGIHWGGLHWRFLPDDFRIRSLLTEKYGAKSIPDDMTIQDWPVSYNELEPHYDKFDKICAVSGQAGNLRGKIVAGGNPFEGPRSDDYPNKPVKTGLGPSLFRDAAKSLGYHPFPLPVATSSAPYVNPEGVTLGACEYCGHCNRTACEANAKASPNVNVLSALRGEPKFELRTRAFVTKLVYDKAGKKVTGVLYTDMRTGEEYEQPAGIVVLSAFVFGNTQQLLLAGIGEPYDPATGKGVVGKNYAYQFEAGGVAFFEDKWMNPFIGAPGMSIAIDDFNGENFDHAGLGFFGGGYIACSNGGAPPIGGRTLPHGTPTWGAEWKRAEAKWYHHNTRFNTQGSVYANSKNFMDLDPTYKDALGRPLIRLTYNGTENDHKMSRFLVAKLEGIIKAMNPTHYDVHYRPKNFTIVPYQSTHNTGGTMMGTDPKSSVVNRYLQAWDAHNLFVLGASVFPQQHGYNPTGTVGALAYWAAQAVTTQYVKNPGPLVHA